MKIFKTYFKHTGYLIKHLNVLSPIWISQYGINPCWQMQNLNVFFKRMTELVKLHENMWHWNSVSTVGFIYPSLDKHPCCLFNIWIIFFPVWIFNIERSLYNTCNILMFFHQYKISWCLIEYKDLESLSTFLCFIRINQMLIFFRIEVYLIFMRFLPLCESVGELSSRKSQRKI